MTHSRSQRCCVSSQFQALPEPRRKVLTIVDRCMGIVLFICWLLANAYVAQLNRSLRHTNDAGTFILEPIPCTAVTKGISYKGVAFLCSMVTFRFDHRRRGNPHAITSFQRSELVGFPGFSGSFNDPFWMVTMK